MDKWWGCLFYEELQILRERNIHRTRLKSVTLVSIEKEWSHCAFWPEGKKLGTYSPLFKRSGWDFSVNPPPFIRLVGTFLNQPQPLVLEQYCCWWWWSFRFQINPGSSYSATTPQNYNSFSIYMVLQMDLAFTWFFSQFWHLHGVSGHFRADRESDNVDIVTITCIAFLSRDCFIIIIKIMSSIKIIIPSELVCCGSNWTEAPYQPLSSPILLRGNNSDTSANCTVYTLLYDTVHYISWTLILYVLISCPSHPKLILFQHIHCTYTHRVLKTAYYR